MSLDAGGDAHTGRACAGAVELIAVGDAPLRLGAGCAGAVGVFVFATGNVHAPVDPGDWTRPSRTGRRRGRRR